MKKIIVLILVLMATVAYANEAENIVLGRMAEFNVNVRNVVNSVKNTGLSSADFRICIEADKQGADLSNVTNSQIVTALGLTNSIDPNSTDSRIIAQFAATRLIISGKCKPVIDGLKQAVGSN